jgi:6-phosphofructokinase 1
VHALRLIVRGDFGKMVALHKGEVVSVPIEKAVERLNLVDPNGDLASTAEELGISLGR